MIKTGAAACIAPLMICVGAPWSHAVARDDAIDRYRPYLTEGIGDVLAGAKVLRDRVVAGDLVGARATWISARARWERSEVFTAGFVPEFDAPIDAWPDASSGFHTIEAKLFGVPGVLAGGEPWSLFNPLVQASQLRGAAPGAAVRHVTH